MARGRILTDCRRWAMCLLLGTLLSASWSVPARAQAQPQLIATPGFGRPNDPFYLAGGSFAPNQPLTVTMFCQDWWHSEYGHWSWTVQVDGQGTFAAYRALVPTPLLIQQTACVLYARKGENPLGVGIPFHIISGDMSLPPEPLSIHLAFHPHRDHSGTTELVHVESAPGAHLVFTACCPQSKPWTYHTRLSWTGHRLLRWRFSGRGKKERMLVTVRARLGDLAGETHTWLQFRTPPSTRQTQPIGAR